jgi:hypothetical protein
VNNNGNRTTLTDGIGMFDAPPVNERAAVHIPLRALVRAVIVLVRERRHLEHRPTLAQVRDLAGWNGRNPSSYLLDPRVNVVPEVPGLLDGQLGRHALCFTASDHGRRRELVALPDGGGFDLLSIVE